MKANLDLHDGNTRYEFDDEAEFEGKKFVSFKKITTYKAKDGQEYKKFQNLTCKTADWLELRTWLLKIIVPGIDKNSVPF